MNDQSTVLIIEDDKAIVDLLTIHLQDQGYRTSSFRNGAEGLKAASTGGFDFVILDIMLPGLDGLSVCRKIREIDISTPILMLTAKTDEIDKIVGLEIGADDYVTKPFSIRELIARIRALQRRSEAASRKEPEAKVTELRICGDLRIHTGKRTVNGRAGPIELTTKEFDLLKVMSDHPGRAFSREELLELVWGYQYDGYLHTVNSHINRLRGKIEADPSHPVLIETVWGFGYRLAENPDGDDS